MVCWHILFMSVYLIISRRSLVWAKVDQLKINLSDIQKICLESENKLLE